MSKTRKRILVIGLPVLLLLFYIIPKYFLIAGTLQDDPFDIREAPFNPNSSQYWFKYDIKINSKKEFLDFLLKHQKDESWPNEKNLLPEYVEVHPLNSLAPYDSGDDASSPEPPKILESVKRNKIDRKILKGNIKKFKIRKSSKGNKFIYELSFGCDKYPELFPDTWEVQIIMSDQGDVSVCHWQGK